MTIQRINALRDLDHRQLANLALQRNIIYAQDVGECCANWSSDSLRLKIIFSICDEEIDCLEGHDH